VSLAIQRNSVEDADVRREKNAAMFTDSSRTSSTETQLVDKTELNFQGSGTTPPLQ